MVLFVGWKDVIIPLFAIGKKTQSKEKRWIEHALTLWKRWSSQWTYFGVGSIHALQQSATESTLCALLPSFHEKLAIPTMIKHGLGI